MALPQVRALTLMPSTTLKEEHLGRIRLQLVRRTDGSLGGRYSRPGDKGTVIDADPDETEDEFWIRLSATALKADPSFFGYDGAIERFDAEFPGGFNDPRYLVQERNYKEAAQQLLNRTAPVQEAATGSGFVQPIVEVCKATNLLHPRFERPRLIEALHSPDGDKLVRRLARFALGERHELAAIARMCRPFQAAIWPVVTYLPFLWECGTRNVILRHKPTANFAERVAHPFPSVYEADLNPSVYESLLDLYENTADRIKSLSPRDVIDLQSFVWVVSEYDA
ncbi:MAG: hypothetical protein OXU72_19165 [Gammaproteobacteria bacterium]|nr:hypothetical protein [Gammaproteobacteria bacterium]